MNPRSKFGARSTTIAKSEGGDANCRLYHVPVLERKRKAKNEEGDRSPNKNRAQDFKATAAPREARACGRRCLSGEDARNGECLKAAALPKTNQMVSIINSQWFTIDY